MKRKNQMRKNKELKHLRRGELIEIIYLLQKNEQKLTAQLEELKEQLDARKLKIADAGSIAEASLAITDIFTSAQETADIYLSEIKRRRDEAEKICQEIIADARKQAEQIIKSAEQSQNYNYKR